MAQAGGASEPRAPRRTAAENIPVDAPCPLNGLECRASESADSDTRARAPRQDYRRLGVDRAAAGAKAGGAKTAAGQIQGA